MCQLYLFQQNKSLKATKLSIGNPPTFLSVLYCNIDNTHTYLLKHRKGRLKVQRSHHRLQVTIRMYMLSSANERTV